jgi:hypothetical protein
MVKYWPKDVIDDAINRRLTDSAFVGLCRLDRT